MYWYCSGMEKKFNSLKTQNLLMVDVGGCIRSISLPNQNFLMECQMNSNILIAQTNILMPNSALLPCTIVIMFKYLLKHIFNWSTLISLELWKTDYQERIECIPNLWCNVQLSCFSVVWILYGFHSLQLAHNQSRESIRDESNATKIFFSLFN